jgi:hypothetical protein
MNQMSTITREMATEIVKKFYNFPLEPRYTNNSMRTMKDYIDTCQDDRTFIEMFHDNNRHRITNKDVTNFLTMMYRILCMFEDKCFNYEYIMNYCTKDLQLCDITVTYLNFANNNFHLINTNERIIEDLTDMAYEENSCFVCHYSHQTDVKAFYYSTTYGLNIPVCYDCVTTCNVVEDDEKDLDYVPSNNIGVIDNGLGNVIDSVDSINNAVVIDNDEATDNDDSVSETSSNNDDPDYIPSDEDSEDSEDEEDTEANDQQANDQQANDQQANDQQANKTEAINNNGIESSVPNDELMEGDYSSDWYNGWTEAIEHVEKQILRAYRTPICNNCSSVGKTKKCGGSCNGCVRYCSTECQIIHWKTTHKYACVKQ